MKKIITIILMSVVMLGFVFGAGNTEEKAVGVATTWPVKGKTYTIVVPSKAGGGTDLAARVMANALQEKTGATFVVLNQNAGGGTVAFETVRHSKPDGTTLLLHNTGFFCSYYSGAYEHSPMEDFSPVAYLFSGTSQSLIANAKRGWSSVDDLVAAAKAKPDSITQGVTIGGSSHLVQGMLNDAANIKLKAVEASSETDKVTGILGDYIGLAVINTKSADQYVKSGDAVVLGILTRDRDMLYPDYKTFAEQGYPSVFWQQDQTLWAAPGTDTALCHEIADKIFECMNDSAVLKKLADTGWGLAYKSWGTSIEMLELTDTSVKESAAVVGWPL